MIIIQLKQLFALLFHSFNFQNLQNQQYMHAKDFEFQSINLKIYCQIFFVIDFEVF